MFRRTMDALGGATQGNEAWLTQELDDLSKKLSLAADKLAPQREIRVISGIELDVTERNSSHQDMLERIMQEAATDLIQRASVIIQPSELSMQDMLALTQDIQAKIGSIQATTNGIEPYAELMADAYDKLKGLALGAAKHDLSELRKTILRSDPSDAKNKLAHQVLTSSKSLKDLLINLQKTAENELSDDNPALDAIEVFLEKHAWMMEAGLNPLETWKPVMGVIEALDEETLEPEEISEEEADLASSDKFFENMTAIRQQFATSESDPLLTSALYECTKVAKLSDTIQIISDLAVSDLAVSGQAQECLDQLRALAKEHHIDLEAPSGLTR